MTPDEQTQLWISGKSVHNPDGPAGTTGGECCPDFSCCRPELAWPIEKRKAFAAATPGQREGMLGASLIGLIGSLGHKVTSGEPSFSTCAHCGKRTELRMGCCYDCAMSGEERAAKSTVRQHLMKFVRNLIRRKWFYAKCDIRWAWQRLTRTGDYRTGGYFDKEGHRWR